VSADVLAGILARKREEIAALRPRLAELQAAAADAGPVRPWAAALRPPDRVALIAELKRRAPSAGSLRPQLDPVELAGTYERAGADALSVLTDAAFDGVLADLEQARGSTAIPALRKDFVLDPVQIYEARAFGADAVLLIVSALTNAELYGLLDVVGEVGMAALVEVHDEGELERALTAQAEVIGINNRNLQTFETNLEVTKRLAGSVPADRVLVAESGIATGAQVEDLGALGVDAVLVGRALVSHPEPGRLAKELASQAKRERS
jgi:indole-3-glycerol phosphate synthase